MIIHIYVDSDGRKHPCDEGEKGAKPPPIYKEMLRDLKLINIHFWAVRNNIVLQRQAAHQLRSDRFKAVP